MEPSNLETARTFSWNAPALKIRQNVMAIANQNVVFFNLCGNFLQTQKPVHGEAPGTLAKCHCVIQGNTMVIQLTSVKVC